MVVMMRLAPANVLVNSTYNPVPQYKVLKEKITSSSVQSISASLSSILACEIQTPKNENKNKAISDVVLSLSAAWTLTFRWSRAA